MRYLKELDLFEIDITVEVLWSNADAILRLVPKKCLGGLGVCKESKTHPSEDNLTVCNSYVRMVSNS